MQQTCIKITTKTQYVDGNQLTLQMKEPFTQVKRKTHTYEKNVFVDETKSTCIQNANANAHRRKSSYIRKENDNVD